MSAVERLSHGEGHHSDARAPPGGERDPVCGMTVDPAAAQHHAGMRDTSTISAAAGAASGSTPTRRVI